MGRKDAVVREVPDGPGRARGRILVVEDDDATRMVLEEVLGLEGYRVRTAADATAGLAVLRVWQPDAVVLDVLMPDLDAPAFRAAQRTLPDAADVPVLLVSAVPTARLEQLAREIGAADWLEKPFDVAEFLDAVARLTQR
jgi:DNA-binding response OmpR family regulator